MPVVAVTMCVQRTVVRPWIDGTSGQRCWPSTRGTWPMLPPCRGQVDLPLLYLDVPRFILFAEKWLWLSHVEPLMSVLRKQLRGLKGSH